MAIRFRIDNWLMASSAVGFAKVLRHAGIDPLPYFRERLLEVPQDLWERLPELYAEYVLRDFDQVVMRSYDQVLKKKDAEWEHVKNPYDLVVRSKLGGFYNNSPLLNSSKSYIRRVAEANKSLIQTYGSEPKEALKKLLQDWENYKVNISKHIKDAIKEAFQSILSVETSDNSPVCFFCRERHSYRTFDAVNFTPLSASPDTFQNLFYNGVNTIFLCKECEVLLYFARFGFADIKGRYLFVYLPDDASSMISVNNVLEERKWLSADIIKESLVVVVKSVEKNKAVWALRNIYVVEIQPVGDAQSNIYVFSLSPRQAQALRDYIDKYPKNLNLIFDIFLKYVYYGKSLYHMLYKIVSGYLFTDSYKNIKLSNDDARLVKYGSNGLWGSLLYLIKFQEVLNMQANKEKEINWAFMEGKKLAQSYKENLGEDRAKKKIESLSYRLLEAVRRRDIDHFSQNLIRAYLEVEKPIPPVFLSAIKEEGLERIAYAFLIGLNGKEGIGEPNTETEDSLGEE
ncbi:MAG: type I-B CRISPR-associated protein Cas8b1/Cst1 [Aquificaceae bacterium]